MGVLVGIVYGVEDQTIHTVIVPDEDASLDKVVLRGTEGVMKISKAYYQRFTSQTELATAIGLRG